MGVPVPSRERELATSQSGDLKTAHITDFPPEQQKELAEKYNIDLDKVKKQPQAPSEASEPEQKELTPEVYLQLKEKGVPDSEIREKFGIKSPNKFTDWKKKHGLDSIRSKPKPDKENRIIISEKGETAYKNGSDPNDLPLVRQLREELAKKDEQLRATIEKYEQLLQQANLRIKEAEARAEAAEQDLLLLSKTPEQKVRDMRLLVAGLLNGETAVVGTTDEFRVLVEVLDKLKMPWTATSDAERFSIKHMAS
jgi:hypothetical protein